jgi:hypothetical protein
MERADNNDLYYSSDQNSNDGDEQENNSNVMDVDDDNIVRPDSFILDITKVDINFLMTRGLIYREVLCPICNNSMRLGFCSRVKDRYRWRCHKGGNNRHDVVQSIRRDSIFENSNIDLKVMIMLVYDLFIERYTIEKSFN